MKQLGSKVIFFNQVLSRSITIEEMTWETEASMRNYYLYLLDVQCEFWGQNSYKGGRNVIIVFSLRG